MVQESNDEDLFSPVSHQPGEDFLIVGLGASAGGINALKQFFSKVRADSGIAYVVILHLSPDHESILAEVLQSNCSIPVVQVKERTLVEPDRVYVIPPNQSLTISDGHLVLSEVAHPSERRAPIDIFFRTLAESHHVRAVCVILSGTGADGSMGMKRVKENGGVCIVQDPDEAEYGDMPRNSIATGLVDYILPVSEMASTITLYKNRRAPLNLITDTGSKPEIEKALRNIFTHLRVRTGHDFSSYKRSTILRRIERRISVNNLPHIAAYSVFMREQPEEATKLLKELLISVTNFFRDASSFEALQKEIISKLLQQKKGEDHVRVWIAGCATGEEAYSVGMLFSEAIEQLPDPPKIQMFATDIDERAIQKAREGYYSLNDAADVSPERLRKFFNKDGDGYRVRRELRELVLFATHNIIKDPPFSQLQLVTCRNLLIYLNRSAQERIMQVMHFALEPGGYLFLGASESIEVARELFVSIDKENHIYRTRPVEARVPLKFDKLTMRPAITLNQSIDRTIPDGVLERLSYFDLHHRLLEKYAPPSIVVNEEQKVLHVSESAGRYLRVGGGEPSDNLLKLVRQELRSELRAALYQAAKLGKDVVARDLKIRIDDEEVTLNLIIKPVVTDETAQQGYTVVLFDETRGEQQSDAMAKVVIVSGAPIAHELEEELARNKAQLRGTIEQHELQQEELKATNEELHAMNEELRSAAEELETSREELQSVNEELTTVNQELNVKIEELSQANSDFQNLIDSTEIATVFLDRSMRVKLFTPRAQDVFSLIPADTGRLLSDINNKLIYDRLLPDIEQAVDRLQTIQRNVRTSDDKEYIMSIFPYRTADDRFDGAVLTFVDVTSGKRAEEARRITEEHLKLLLESIKDYAIFSMEKKGKIKSWGPGAELIFGYATDEVIGQDAAIIFTAEDRAAGIPEQEMITALRKGRAADERWHVRKDGSRFYASGVLAPLLSENGGFVKIARDLTEEKLLAEELQQAHDELETRVASRTSELANANESLRLEVLERIRSEGLRVELNRRLVRAQEDERQRIARDLHDQMGQQLTALRLKLETLKNNFTFENNAATQVEECQNIALQIEAEVDFLAWELRPAALDDLGLKETLAAYVTTWSDHYGIAAEFHSSLDHERLASEVETNLYRIAQEALNNICKHAQAKRVDVILERRDNEVVLIIEDDGVGFDAKADPAGGSRLGLVGMSERTLLMGGKLDIESVPKQGTTLFARVPISEANQP